VSLSGEIWHERIEELKAEIERLKAEVDWKLERIQWLEQSVNAQRSLLNRAAEVLEKWNIRHRFSELILELREAAK
jgi:uncharacterized small protein (DUF1192 family)